MRITKIFFICFLILLISTCYVFAQNEKLIIRFGLIADIQYADTEPERSRFYRNSLEKLEKCVSYFNESKVDFSINVGDIVDRDPAGIDSVLCT